MDPRPRRPLGRRLLAGGLALVAPLTLGPLALLTVVAATRGGRLVGWFAVAGLIATLAAAALIWPGLGRPRVAATILVASLFAAAGLAVAIAGRPTLDGEGGPTGLRSVTLGPGRVGPRLLSVLPEGDLVRLGARLATLAPVFADGRRIRDRMAATYAAIEADPAGGSIRSVVPLALDELVGKRFDIGHYFAYVPAHEPGEALAAVVFLHGNAGNFLAMPWAWRPFADARRVVVVCPTYGYGFWGPGGAEAVDRALDDALARLPIDPRRVDLGGISDGGVGVTRAARSRPSRYRGLIYVSPTMLPAEVGSADFLAAWRGRPALVLTGSADFSVRRATVDAGVDRLRDGGVDVTYRVFEGEDHFLFFGRAAEVFAAVGAWSDHPSPR